ncbi:acyltransferase family protein [Massilia sp. BJB1822]|nr:acyltransferase family protein [Massilia sp. BJB1822]
MQQQSLAYRADIDGLRALAILPVLFFHAMPQRLPGGFAGVDVFFVISGFLITGLILQAQARGDFSLLRFYGARIRRLFPALILVLLACLAFGWLDLLPDEFAQLSRHASAGAVFLQNFQLWRETGYFDTLSEHKPLLHLWSLSIEEQFYLLYPLLLLAAARWRLRPAWLIALLGLLSFVANLYLTANQPTTAFFAPQARAWELLAGAALACHQRAGAGGPQPRSGRAAGPGLAAAGLWRAAGRGRLSGLARPVAGERGAAVAGGRAASLDQPAPAGGAAPGLGRADQLSPVSVALAAAGLLTHHRRLAEQRAQSGPGAEFPAGLADLALCRTAAAPWPAGLAPDGRPGRQPGRARPIQPVPAGADRAGPASHAQPAGRQRLHAALPRQLQRHHAAAARRGRLVPCGQCRRGGARRRAARRQHGE